MIEGLLTNLITDKLDRVVKLKFIFLLPFSIGLTYFLKSYLNLNLFFSLALILGVLSIGFSYLLKRATEKRIIQSIKRIDFISAFSKIESILSGNADLFDDVNLLSMGKKYIFLFVITCIFTTLFFVIFQMYFILTFVTQETYLQPLLLFSLMVFSYTLVKESSIFEKKDFVSKILEKYSFNKLDKNVIIKKMLELVLFALTPIMNIKKDIFVIKEVVVMNNPELSNFIGDLESGKFVYENLAISIKNSENDKTYDQMRKTTCYDSPQKLLRPPIKILKELFDSDVNKEHVIRYVINVNDSFYGRMYLWRISANSLEKGFRGENKDEKAFFMIILIGQSGIVDYLNFKLNSLATPLGSNKVHAN